MIIIGHPLIPHESLYKVTKATNINKTKANSTILLDFIDKKLLEYINTQDISFALHVKSIKDACLANALGAKFIVVDDTISKEIQNIATEYLFDSKIILQIQNEDEIEKAAKNFIDGVVLKEGIV